MNDHLAARLREAADDGGRPFRTDPTALLERARRSRRRHRAAVTGSVLAGVVVATAAVLVVPALGSDDDAGEPAAPPSTAPTSTPRLDLAYPDAAVVRLCRPQLEKYLDLPMYADVEWRVAHDRDYRAGEVALLSGGERSSSNPVLCLVPEDGREGEPVPFERFSPAGSGRPQVAELCSEQYTGQVDGEPWVDLRDAEVVALDRAGPPVATALLRLGGDYYSCSLSPVTWDAGVTEVRRTGRWDLGFSASSTGIKSIVGDRATYYYGAGLTDPAADRLRITFPDGQEVLRPVEDGGAYAVMLRMPDPDGLGVQDARVEALAPDGTVLAESPDY